MEEIWKDVKGYEGLYQVSNLGRCRSLDRIVLCNTLLGNVGSYVHKGKILSNKRTNHKNGYIRLSLVKDGVYKQYYLHKLVAEAFIPNLKNKAYVDHIDTNKLNNCISNLRWVSIVENNNNPITKKHLAARKYTRKKYYYNGDSALNLCKKLDIKPTTFYRRVNELGWSIEKAIDTPVKK